MVRAAAGPARKALRQCITADKGVIMTTSSAPTRATTITLRRQKAHTQGGNLDGGYTNAFEIICSDCGDDPRRDYQDVPPRLQRLRGPYLLDTGVTQYEAHVAWHEDLVRAR